MKDKKILSFFRPNRANELIYEIGAQISAELDPHRLLLLSFFQKVRDRFFY
jgi:hypothetical protein